MMSKDNDYLVVWVRLLLLAEYSEKKAVFNGKIIDLKPGQLITNRKELSKLCNVSESKLERVLKLLETCSQIEQQTNNRSRCISILNWRKYQETEQPTNSQRTANEQPINIEDKEEKNINSKPNIIKSVSASYPPKNTSYSQPAGSLDTFKDEGKYINFIKTILQERDEFKMVGYSQLIDQRIVFLNLANRQTIGNPESYFRQWIIGRLEDGKLEVRNLVTKKRGK